MASLNIKPLPAGLSGPHPPAGCPGTRHSTPCPDAENQAKGRGTPGSRACVQGPPHTPRHQPRRRGLLPVRPGTVPTPASGRTRLQGPWHVEGEGRWHPGPHLGERQVKGSWLLPTTGAERLGCSHFLRRPHRQALQPGCQPAVSAIPGQPGSGPQASSGTSPGPSHASPLPRGAVPRSLFTPHTHRTTSPSSAPQPLHLSVPPLRICKMGLPGGLRECVGRVSQLGPRARALQAVTPGASVPI